MKDAALHLLMLNEAQIKTAVIGRLLNSGALKDAVLINEMVVGNWSRRADLAVANGKLHAFEIKSDLDTLKRLEGQVGTYIRYFDKVTVVTTEKFLKATIDMLPIEVEIWVAEHTIHGVKIRIARRGRTREICDKQSLCGFLHKPEIVALLRKHGVSSSTDVSRSELVQLASDLPLKRVREEVLLTLKNRYKKSFENFIQSTANLQGMSLSSLRKVRRPLRVHLCKADVLTAKIANSRAIELNISLLESKFGTLPESMPKHVLLRAPREHA